MKTINFNTHIYKLNRSIVNSLLKVKSVLQKKQAHHISLVTGLVYVLFSSINSHAQSALSFGGTNAYVTFGNNTQLGLPEFTLEVWFMRTGTGIATSTGTGGTMAIPLLAKGRAEVDGDNRDLNYFLGINSTTNCLVADLEEDFSQPNPGLNHPVNGLTVILNNVWYHAAVTYDGTNWKLYLNGLLETQLTVGILPQSASIQHASLASALTSTGNASGFFMGTLDEARIWNYARSQTEIQSSINLQLNSMQAGLVAIWGLNEGIGTIINDSSSHAINGSITGSDYLWTTNGAPYNLSFNVPPNQPSQPFPTDSATCVFSETNISVSVTDAEADSMSVTFYLVQQPPPAPPDFTLVGIPDTQYYTGELNGGTNEMFKSQTQWIINNMDSLHIVFAEGLGDCVQNGDNGNDSAEWMRCDTAFAYLEDTLTTQLADGLPYGINVGNHDQSPAGSATGTTALFNYYFGAARFSGKNYYGGHFGADNNSNYCLFSSGGLDFIVINFEYDDNRDTAEINWAHALLLTYSTRRAILASHYMLELNGTFSTQGQLLYDAFKIHPNVFMTMSGHVPGESSRQDTYQGNTIYSIMSDYQGRTNGGNGWLRLYHFSPATNSILVKTYSPWLNQWETDANSQFTIAYQMTPPVLFQNMGTVNNVASGTDATITVQNLLPNTTYQWYVTVSDSSGTTTSQIFQFSTASAPAVNIGNDTAICSLCTVVLNAGIGYSSYLWNDASTNSTLNASAPGIYYVVATDAAGCISSDTIFISTISTVNEKAVQDQLILFPNPTCDAIWLNSTFLEEVNEFTLKITDVMGKVNYETNSLNAQKNNFIRISTSGFPPGVYFVEITSLGKRWKTNFIKQ